MSDDEKRNSPSDGGIFDEIANVFGSSGHGGSNVFGAARKASTDRSADAGSTGSTAEAQYYRAPCPHCGHEHTVKFKGRPGKAYEFVCTACDEPFAWMATDAALIETRGETSRAPDRTGGIGADVSSNRSEARRRLRERIAAPFTPTAWSAGLAAGAGLMLATPADLVPTWAGPWIADLLGYGDLVEAFLVILILAVLLGVVWQFTYALALIVPRLARTMGAVQGLVSGAAVGYALVLPFFLWSLDRWLVTVEAGTLWGTGTAVLGGVALALAYGMRTRAVRSARWLKRLGVGFVVLGAAGLSIHAVTFGADDPPRVIQSHIAEQQLVAAREAAATASTEAERQRADALFSEAGVTASRSGDLDRLEEALDAHIEFAGQ